MTRGECLIASNTFGGRWPTSRRICSTCTELLPSSLSLSHPLSLSVSLSRSAASPLLPSSSEFVLHSLQSGPCAQNDVSLTSTPTYSSVCFQYLTLFSFLFFLNLKNPGSSICNLPNCRHNVRRSPAAAVRPSAVVRPAARCGGLLRVIRSRLLQCGAVKLQTMSWEE